MTACPTCGSEKIRAGWPEASMTMLVDPKRALYAKRNGLLVPLTCKKCGHRWSISYLPPATEGELADKKEAEA
jgi:hypothetical protein